MLDYIVLYESETGNTKRLATEIFAALPGMDKDIIAIQDCDRIPEARTYFIGFCVHQGTCSLEVGNLLQGLSEKNVALFGTCGMGNQKEHYRSIENSASIWLEDDNHYLGAYFCQGKMPLKIRQKFEGMLPDAANQEETDKIKRQIHNFDEAMIHPTDEDIAAAREFIKNCLEMPDML